MKVGFMGLVNLSSGRSDGDISIVHCIVLCQLLGRYRIFKVVLRPYARRAACVC